MSWCCSIYPPPCVCLHHSLLAHIPVVLLSYFLTKAILCILSPTCTRSNSTFFLGSESGITDLSNQVCSMAMLSYMLLKPGWEGDSSVKISYELGGISAMRHWHSSRARGHPPFLCSAVWTGRNHRGPGQGSQAAAGSILMYFISGWPLTGVDLWMGRGEGSKRGIRGTLASLHFKHQLAQHSRTVRCNL